MAVTIAPSGAYGQAARGASAGLSNLADTILKRKQLGLSERQLAESEKSGKMNRAYQEALAGKADADANTARMRNKAIASLPPGVYNKLVQDELAAKGKTIANMTSQINLLTLMQSNQAKVEALNKENMIKDFAIDKANSMKPYVEGLAKADAIMSKARAQSAEAQALKDAKDARDRDRNEATKGMSALGRGTVNDAIAAGTPLAEALQLGLDAEKSEAMRVAEYTRTQTIAENRRKEDARKSPTDKKLEAKGYGAGTYERRQDAIENSIPVKESFALEFDLPGITGKSKKGIYRIDIDEAREHDKTMGLTGDNSLESQWLKKYEGAYNEPYEDTEKSETSKSEKSEKEKAGPPASVVKTRDEKYPGAEIIFKDGKWGIVE